jgi:hypothetical protein
MASLIASFERAAPVRDANHCGAQQAHAEDIQPLPSHVLFAHVDDALHAHQRANCSCCHAMLAGSGLRDDALLAHALRKQDLPQAVVDLVRAGVQKVFPFQPDLSAAQVSRSASWHRTAASAAPRSSSAGTAVRPRKRDPLEPRDKLSRVHPGVTSTLQEHSARHKDQSGPMRPAPAISRARSGVT